MNVFIDDNLKIKSKDQIKILMNIRDEILKKTDVFDFTTTVITKSEYLFHDLFYQNGNLYGIYKSHRYRILFTCDVKNEELVILSLFKKEKNHIKYYKHFRDIAKDRIVA